MPFTTTSALSKPRIFLAVAAALILLFSLLVPVGKANAASTELVDNGDFAAGLTGWEPTSASQKLVLRGSKQKYGSVWAAAGGSLGIADGAPSVASSPADTTYELSARVRTQYGSLSGQIRALEVGASATASHVQSFQLADSTWHTVSLRFTTTHPAASLHLDVTGTGASPYQPLQVDNISLTVVSVEPPLTPPPATAPGPTPTTPPVSSGCEREVPGGTRFGVTLDIPGGMNFQEAWTHAVNSYGAPEVVRVFNPGAPANWSAATIAAGADLSVSFKIPPRDILSGAYDGELRTWFRSAPKNVEVYWTYYHEPEDDIERGSFTAAEYRAAWQRVVSISRETCQTNMHSMLILMGWTVDPLSGRDFDSYYPGSAYIDVLGWDPYNPWKQNTGYQSPASIFGRVVATSGAEGKPFAIAETGSLLMGGDNGTGRATWLYDIADYLKQHGALFVSYFDTVDPNIGDWRLNDAPSRSAWRSIVPG